MATVNDSILLSVKKNIGIVESYEVFDDQLINHINAAFATLHQYGFGPKNGYEITDKDNLWSEIVTTPKYNLVKAYVTDFVHLHFDPPTSSYALDELRKQVEEESYRIMMQVETGDSVDEEVT